MKSKKEKFELLEVEKRGEVAFPNSSWGSQLPPATPKSRKPLPTWRPWELENLPKVWQPKLPKFKKRSPASEARSRRRLLEWQWHRDSRRGLEQLTPVESATPLPPPRELNNVRLLDRLEGGKLGSQALPPIQWSGSQTSPSSPSWSGSQTFPASSSWSGSQTSPSPPPWSGDQGIEHQDYWLSAST